MVYKFKLRRILHAVKSYINNFKFYFYINSKLVCTFTI